MALINVRDVSVTLGAPLFEGLSFALEAGDRLGLVAANGRGKSTLLACLAGSGEVTSGEITRARGLRVGHVSQNVPKSILGLTLYEAVLGALSEEAAAEESWRVDVVLDMLDIPAERRAQKIGDLSGGWQRLCLLARVWVTDPDVLLLDEPTNHLDLTRIGRLEDWLGMLPRDFPVIICSHDRAFLDAVTTRTLFLRESRSAVFALPYSKALVALEEGDAADARRFENEHKQAQQLRRQAAKLKNIGINSGSDLLITKTKQLNQRAEAIEERARAAHQDRSAGAIKLGNSGTHAKALISLDDPEVVTPDGTGLFRIGKKWISPGDRIVLLGANGTGKTQMVRLLQRAIAAEGGEGVGVSPTLKLGYSDQELSQLEGGETPHNAICSRFDVGDQAARGMLAAAGMRFDLQTRPISVLSGGQKSRLAMLILRLSHPNFYLLDEPTNHLDIEGQEALEEELTAHGAACVLVTHDRSFMRTVGNRFWQIERRRLIEVDDPEPFIAGALAGA